MNKRQEEKHFKRKWKEVFCKVFNETMGLNIKPSRMKLRIIENEDHYCFIGGFSGYSFNIEGDLVGVKNERSNKH